MTTTPQPVVNEVTEPFWTALNEHRISVQRCQQDGCGQVFLYPRVCCPYCHGDQLEWINVTGQGTIISHTTIYRAHHPGFEGQVPYVFAAIELAEGALIYAQLPGVPASGPSLVGRSVKALFQDQGGPAAAPGSPTQTLLAFQLDD